MEDLIQVLPFLGATTDRLTGELSSAPTTRVFVLYTDMVQNIERRHNVDVCFTTDDLRG